jgi:tight adherence protein B
MLMEFLPFIPALGVFFMVLGVYKVFYEKQSKAQENIMDAQYRKGDVSSTSSAGILIPGNRVLKQQNRNKNSLLYKLELMLELANLLIKPNEYLMIALIFGTFFLFISFLVTQNVPLSLMLGLVSLVIPYLYLKVKIWLRLKTAAEQFPDVLDTMVSCFKTGYGINRTLKVVAEKYNDPWGTEFTKILSEVNLGSTLETALESLFERMPTADVELFVSAILIQKDTGGNLGEVLDNLSKTCRNRYQFFRTVNTLAAQGKLSALIVSLIPFFLMAVMAVMLPKGASDFVTNPIGIALMIIVGIWMLCGYGVLYKTVQIEV